MRLRTWITGVALIAIMMMVAMYSRDDSEGVDVSPTRMMGRGGFPETGTEMATSQPQINANANTASGQSQWIADVSWVATTKPDAARMDNDQRMAMLWASDPVASLMPGLGGQTPEQQLESLKWMAKVPDKKASSFPDLRGAIDLSPQEREEIALRRIQELMALLEADGYYVDEETIPDNPIELRTDGEEGVQIPSAPDFIP